MHHNRRQFLKGCCGLGAAGVAAHLTQLGLISARADTGTDYKALVCVFFFGGHDSNNFIVPIDSRYAAYQTMRGAVALGQATLLPAGGTGFGFHPALPNVKRIFDLGRAATVFNVGTLVRPTTRLTLNTTPLPKNLYSHSDQTQQWQTSDPNGGGFGWGGRVNDTTVAQNTGSLPPGISLQGGNSLFLSGPVTKGLSFSNAASFGLATFGDTAAMDARVTSLEKLLTFDSGLQLVSAANGVLADGMRSAKEIDTALNSGPPLPVTFPATTLGQQLAQAAQIIAVRGALGMQRQIFFAGLGGFDHHENLLVRHQQLLAQVDAAFNAFYNTMELTGMMNNITLFTSSEFNRTGNANANIGTDHAWGGHQLVMGGAVHGNATYGTFPVHALSGPDDAGSRGNWIPSTSLDQYAATLAGWFGVSDGDLNPMFPNLANFSPQKLAFL